MEKEEIRWKQRFENYLKALSRLQDAVDLSKKRKLSDLEEQGLIQSFEFTHELAWNVMKDYFTYQGIAGITGSRDAVREAFNKGLITEGEIWMQMIKSRNQSSHTYNEGVANQLVEDILNNYFPQFQIFSNTMSALQIKS